jgi:hypothetical protein
MGVQRYGRKSKPWSKLRTRIEALWVPSLNLNIHCSVHSYATTHERFDQPRYWITLDGETVWDTGELLSTQVIPYYYDIRHVSELLREYLDRARDKLFDPFDDHYDGLTDILRAADRRLGFSRLTLWTLRDPPPSPGARRILRARFVKEHSEESLAS